MVQIKQKRGIGVENPSPRSFSGGESCVCMYVCVRVYRIISAHDCNLHPSHCVSFQYRDQEACVHMPTLEFDMVVSLGFFFYCTTCVYYRDQEGCVRMPTMEFNGGQRYSVSF